MYAGLLILTREVPKVIGDLGLHQNVEACDWTVQSERAGEPLEFRIDKRATQKKRYESSVCFV